MNYKNLLFISAALYTTVILIPSVFLHGCQQNWFPGDTAVQPDTTTITIDLPPPAACDSAQKFSAILCTDDNEEVHWEGLWEECFNLGCETSWEPALGIMCIRCLFPLCENGFRWEAVERICGVPGEYAWTVHPELNYWEGCLTFERNECLAESNPNCYKFRLFAANCPY